MRRRKPQDGRDSQRGARGADSRQPSLLHTRAEKAELLIRGLAAIPDRFARRGHLEDAMHFVWWVERKTGPNGRCGVEQALLNGLLGWGENQRKFKEVRDALEAAGWIEVIRECPTCRDSRYKAVRLNWPSIAAAAARGDVDHHLVTLITKWWRSSPFGDDDHHAPHKEYENSECENLTKPHAQNSPARAGAAKPPRDWWLPPHLRERTERPEDARRLLRTAWFVREAWEDARARLPDLTPRDYRGFAVTAHHAARPDGNVRHAGRLFVDNVGRRAWRLPPGAEGHIPNAAEDDARPLLVELGLAPSRPEAGDRVDPDAAAAAERERKLAEARRLVADFAARASAERDREVRPK